MLTASRLRERQAAEAALAAAKNPPVPESPRQTEAEILQDRFRAKQDAAREELRRKALPGEKPAVASGAPQHSILQQLQPADGAPPQGDKPETPKQQQPKRPVQGDKPK